MTAVENQEPKARRRAAGALQVARCPQLWAMLPVLPSVALRAPCFVVSAGSLGRLSQALRDATELPLRKPTAVFCGHGPTMHTGMDHTFSRKWVSGAHDSLCLLFREVAYCVWLRHKNRWLTWWHKHVVSVHSPEVITCWALCGISTPWENQKHNWEKKKKDAETLLFSRCFSELANFRPLGCVSQRWEVCAGLVGNGVSVNQWTLGKHGATS